MQYLKSGQFFKALHITALGKSSPKPTKVNWAASCSIGLAKGFCPAVHSDHYVEQLVVAVEAVVVRPATGHSFALPPGDEVLGLPSTIDTPGCSRQRGQRWTSGGRELVWTGTDWRAAERWLTVRSPGALPGRQRSAAWRADRTVGWNWC